MPGRRKASVHLVRSRQVSESDEKTHENKHIRLPTTESALLFFRWIHAWLRNNFRVNARHILGSKSGSPQYRFSQSGLGAICRAESRQGRAVREDRSGPGNDKSTYGSKTGRGEGRQAGPALFFSTDNLLPYVASEPPSCTTAIITRTDTVQSFPAAGERSHTDWIVVVALHIIALFSIREGKKSVLLFPLLSLSLFFVVVIKLSIIDKRGWHTAPCWQPQQRQLYSV